MKGIILAGGKGSRLFPTTLGASKQLLAIYDKPLLYYPLSVLLQASIQEILIISTPNDIVSYQDLLGDGSQLGISITYATQPEPNGIAEAFIIGQDFLANDSVCLILGDNIFIGDNFSGKFPSPKDNFSGAKVFGYQVSDPERFGVISNIEGKIMIEEKPKKPKSSYAVTGLYFYDKNVVEIARSLKPSKRGELEITDVNIAYLKNDQLDVVFLDEGFSWFDAGTHDSMIQAGNYVQTIQNRQATVISCPEAIAYKNGWIGRKEVLEMAEKYNNHYGDYLQKIANHQKS